MVNPAEGRIAGQPKRREVHKAVAYVVHEGRLLVFTHDHTPIELAGVQVPAGTVEPGESPEEAVVREVFEETGVRARVVRALGVGYYDVWPTKQEIHERHYFQLELLDGTPRERWSAGEQCPSDGGAPETWTCWWTPLEKAHVLCAGLGARLGGIVLDDPIDQ